MHPKKISWTGWNDGSVFLTLLAYNKKGSTGNG